MRKKKKKTKVSNYTFYVVMAAASIALGLGLGIGLSGNSCDEECLPKVNTSEDGIYFWVPPSEGLELRRLCNCNDYSIRDLDEMGLENPRDISNEFFAETMAILDPRYTSGIWVFGQFIDHNIILTRANSTAEPLFVSVDDPEDLFFQNGIFNLTFEPAVVVEDENGCDVQITDQGGFLDGVGIYGNTEELAAELRDMAGDGMLKVQIIGREEYMVRQGGGWLAGDPRAAETVPLSAMHTLFVRNHNRWCRRIRTLRPDWTGDEVYEKARQLNVAEFQVLVYQEWLPRVIGRTLQLDMSEGLISETKNQLFLEFGLSAFRFGHTAVTAVIGPFQVMDFFFQPDRLIENGLTQWLRWVQETPGSRIDANVTDALRNFLFGNMGEDLVTRNLQRARQVGLPTFEEFQRCLYEQPSGGASDPRTDLFLGLLAEESLFDVGAATPPTLTDFLALQFKELAEGDPNFYLRIKDDIGELFWPEVTSITMVELIRRNTPGMAFPNPSFFDRT